MRASAPALAALMLVLTSGWVNGAEAQCAGASRLQQYARDGERALAAGRYADAEKAFEALSRLSPETAEVHAQLGLARFQQGKFGEAVPPLRRALALKPALPRIDTLLAMSLSELGQYEEALPTLVTAFARADDPVIRRMAGLHLQRAYTGLARDREAVETALALSRLYPDDPEVLYHSGRLFANFAYLQAMKLSKVAPDSVWLHQAAGEANESQGLHDAALTEYRAALALGPRRPGLHFRIGRTLLARSKEAASDADAVEARNAFLEELRIDPTNANAAYELAEMHRTAGELEEARELFERAVKHYPQFEHALVGLGRTLIALRHAELALPPLLSAAKRNPASTVAYYLLAQAYRALGRPADHDAALAEFTRLRALASGGSSPIPGPKSDVTPQAIDAKPPS
jgi:predicted Zn-dependent protease